MTIENRKGMPPVPSNFGVILTYAQLRALRVVKQYGWKLSFVRRVNLQQAIPVIMHADRDNHGVLEADGGVNLKPDIKIRI